MKINPIFANNFNYNKKSPVIFASTREHTVKYGIAVNCNYTNIFRSDIDWDKFVDYLDTKYKNVNKANIYCYACSDGSEPYSLAIKLIDKLGMEKAQKFFPIQARDIDNKQIDIAKQGVLYLYSGDIKSIDDNLSNLKFNQIFRQNKNMYSSIQRNILFVPCDINPEIKKCVEFSQGDITKDIQDLDLNNSTLIFRNAWTYLSLERQEELAKTISNKLEKSSCVLIGNSDILKSNASEYLSKTRLKPIDKGVYVGGETDYPSNTIGLPRKKTIIPNV